MKLWYAIVFSSMCESLLSLFFSILLLLLCGGESPLLRQHPETREGERGPRTGTGLTRLTPDSACAAFTSPRLCAFIKPFFSLCPRLSLLLQLNPQKPMRRNLLLIKQTLRFFRVYIRINARALLRPRPCLCEGLIADERSGSRNLSAREFISASSTELALQSLLSRSNSLERIKISLEIYIEMSKRQ